MWSEIWTSQHVSVLTVSSLQYGIGISMVSFIFSPITVAKINSHECQTQWHRVRLEMIICPSWFFMCGNLFFFFLEGVREWGTMRPKAIGHVRMVSVLCKGLRYSLWREIPVGEHVRDRNLSEILNSTRDARLVRR